MSRDLEAAIAALTKEEQSLEHRLGVVKRTLSGLRELSLNGNAPEPRVIKPASLTEKIHPDDAALAFFDRDFSRKIYPADVRDEFASLRDAGRLDSGQGDLLQLAHSTLRKLERKGEIEKQKGGAKLAPKWFRKVIRN